MLGTAKEAARRIAGGLGDMVHSDDLAMVQHALQQTLQIGSPFQAEFRALRPDGSTLWLAAQGRLESDADGKPVRIIGASVDVTHHKQLEAELRQAQKMEAIGQLAGGVAHDFNNILTIILGEASLLTLRGGLAPEPAKHVRSIVSAAGRAASLTAQLLAFGRRRIMHMREVDLNQIVSEFVAMVRRLLGEDITLVAEPAPHPVWVQADPSMLSQVLLNLGVNARDAMPRGGRLMLSVSLEVLDELSARAVPGVTPGTWACLRVSDTGLGIAENVLPHIFEPFFTTKEVGKGSGLGLATVHGIVTQHGGGIRINTTLGQGTTFEILLRAIAHQSPRQPVTPQRGHLHGRGETILLVEDESDVRAVLKNILEQYGYELLTAGSGQEALALFKQHATRISLLLTDVVMPGGLTGADLVERLRAEKPSLKAVLSSGYGAQALGTQFVEKGGVSFLRKPYKAEDLLRQVRQVLED